MDHSRPIRGVALAALLVAAAVVGLLTLGRSGRSGPGQGRSAERSTTVKGTPAIGRSPQATGSAATGAPPTTPVASGPVATTHAPAITSTTTTTTTVASADDPVLPLATVKLTVEAHNNSGAAVDVPTAVWYPAAGGPFPLLVFSPGYQVDPAVYDPLVRAWAAAGYVVAEPTYPYTAPGTPPIEYDMINHPRELSQVISAVLADSAASQGPLAGVADPSRVAVAGQSDGGDVSLAAVANNLYIDHRIKAAVILSGAEQSLFEGSYYSLTGNPPILVVQGDADTINPPACSQELYNAARPPRYYLDLPLASHLSAYTGSGLQFDVVRRTSTAFLDGYVSQRPGRIAALPALGQVAGVSRLYSGATTVPVVGACPGAPPGTA
jgi:dienelactone hydrolase